MRKTARLVLLILLLSAGNALAQGYLMLAGGAGESAGGWSDIPYAWVVEHAANKRVAIVSYSADQTQWLPDYFKSFGAVDADNITIADRITADQQWLYDSLVKYDAVFLRGGDQYRYYDLYKGTKTEQALQDIYDRGGVLSGTSAGNAILSPIVFTAEVASVDPAQAQLNAYSGQVTLEDDFLETRDERFIYDTHFQERGRFGRLPVFMANWYRDRGEIATGIGVDDHTAFCIEPGGQATVYGTGAVSILKSLDESAPFDTGEKMLRSGPMQINQLIHGCTIDLGTSAIEGLEQSVEPPVVEENRRNTIVISGTDYPSDASMTYFLDDTPGANDTVVIITGNSTERALAVQGMLLKAGAAEAPVLQALSANQVDAETARLLTSADKLVVVGATYDTFFGFIEGEGNGTLLEQRLKEPGMSSYFIGDNARFAGKTVVDKYMGYGYTSYHGELEFKPGLGLLETTAIMPYTFVYNEYIENTVSGLPYAMMLDELAFGFYISGSTYAAYIYTSDLESYVTSVGGSFPLVFLENEGTVAGFASHGPYEQSRNVAGFESMNLRFMAPGDSVRLGTHVPVTVQPDHHDTWMSYWPNPVENRLQLSCLPGSYVIELYSVAGARILNKTVNGNSAISLEGIPPGLFILKLHDTRGGRTHVGRLIHY